ncbi:MULTISPECIES: hypothetical protein [Niastella]|uniref:Uncharacterized protein n=1 Tax=Niastella soli TaxID=2821487 RepID=A0ABS3YR07_9BACT|nr:hypothetical protein [Niastella soli]MBO9199631.1 hypothetical protein [Niastella soli]
MLKVEEVAKVENAGNNQNFFCRQHAMMQIMNDEAGISPVEFIRDYLF